MIANKNTLATSTIHWTSKNIERIVQNSTAAETIATKKMSSTIFFAEKVLEERCGQRGRNLQGVALTDNQRRFSNIHYLKPTMDDFRLHADILELGQGTVQEARYVYPLLNIVNALTRTTKTRVMLLRLVQTGQYDLPRGTFVRDSTMSSIRTWNELLRVQQQEERSQGEVDKTSTDNQIVAMNQESDPETNIAEQNLNSCKASMKELQHRKIANQQTISNQREEEEDNTNQRALFIPVQTQGPTKGGGKEQRRRRQ